MAHYRSGTRRATWRCGAAASGLALVLVLASGRAVAEPVVGVETLAAFPTSGARAVAKPGGALRLDGGYRFPLGGTFALSLLGDAGATIFETRCGPDAVVCKGDDTTTFLSLLGGPRLSLIDGDFELFFGVRAGTYLGVSGGPDDFEGGWGLEAGAKYELVPGSSLGLLIRREQIFFDPGTDSSDFEFIVVGLGFEHRFAPGARAVAQPRPRPEF